jgi:zinc protease
MVVVGNVTEEDLKPIFKLWNSKPSTGPELVSDKGEFNSFDGFKIYFIPKEKAPQSEIRIGYVAMPYDATGTYYKTSVANFPFGGNFNSRINLNLREKRGFTYGTRSGFESSDLAGPFYITGGFKGIVTDSSMIELVSELKNFHQKGISEEELAFTKSSLGQADALKFEAPPQKGRFLKRLLDYKLETNYLDKQNEILKNLTVKELNGNISKYFNLQNMVSVVVGDPKNIDKLKAAGFTVEEIKP